MLPVTSTSPIKKKQPLLGALPAGNSETLNSPEQSFWGFDPVPVLGLNDSLAQPSKILKTNSGHKSLIFDQSHTQTTSEPPYPPLPPLFSSQSWWSVDSPQANFSTPPSSPKGPQAGDSTPPSSPLTLIDFSSSIKQVGEGQFHKAYLVTEKNGQQLIHKKLKTHMGTWPALGGKHGAQDKIDQAKVMQRQQNLYNLAVQAGIPVAQSEFDAATFTTKQEVCTKINLEDESQQKQIIKIFTQIGNLWAHGVFVLFDPSKGNFMLNGEGKVVMIDFGGERSSIDFECGGNMGATMKAILQEFQLPEEIHNQILNILISAVGPQNNDQPLTNAEEIKEYFLQNIANSYDCTSSAETTASPFFSTEATTTSGNVGDNIDVFTTFFMEESTTSPASVPNGVEISISDSSAQNSNQSDIGSNLSSKQPNTEANLHLGSNSNKSQIELSEILVEIATKNTSTSVLNKLKNEKDFKEDLLQTLEFPMVLSQFNEDIFGSPNNCK